MGDINTHTINRAKKFVYDLLDHYLAEGYVFHSKAHTLHVTADAETIGKYSGLSDKEMKILLISALFHDAGYTKTYKEHERESALIARGFLTNEHIDESVIQQITAAILATKVPQNPKDKLSGMLCDADLMHLTYDNYFDHIDLLRIEWELMGIAKMSVNEFHLNSVDFFNSHHFHSEYGKQVLTPKKEKNLNRIKEKLSIRE